MKPEFWIEFRNNKESYVIYKRNYIKEFDTGHPLMSGEFHPFKIMEGKVAPEEQMWLETEVMLLFMVDAMNEKFNRGKSMRELAKEHGFEQVSDEEFKENLEHYYDTRRD